MPHCGTNAPSETEYCSADWWRYSPEQPVSGSIEVACTGFCHLFGIHRSVYYAPRKSSINVQRVELRSRVRAFDALRCGDASSWTISQMLRQSGIDAGWWLVRSLMQAWGWQAASRLNTVTEKTMTIVRHCQTYWVGSLTLQPPTASGEVISVLFTCRTNGAISHLSLIYMHAELSVQPFH